MDMEASVPPGFRFHPTEEELVGYYLKRKVNSLKIDLNVIVDIDLYRMEPWDIQDRCRLGYEEQNEWYFFSHKDRKYPTGTRTNRATAAGFWKATGRDKAVVSKERIIGMRKTLVFYRGRAPNGRKSDWIMHEYRLQTSEHGPPQEEGWVVCRAFKKATPSHKQGYEAWTNTYNRLPSIPDASSSRMRPMNSFTQRTNSNEFQNFAFASDQQALLMSSNPTDFETPFLELPQLDSPTISTSLATNNEDLQDDNSNNNNNNNNYGYDQYTEWKVFDKLISSNYNAVQPLSDACQNFPLLPAEDDRSNGENHESHVLGCFSEL